MFYLMLVFSIVPLGLGLAIKTLFGNTRLSKSLFVFMVCISVWQMDVAILFANRYVSTATIDFLFRLFRFGTIMLPAALLYVTYVIYQEHVDRRKLSAGWQLLINRGMLQAFGLWCLTVYAAGWTSGSIRSFIVVQSDKTAGFLFPVYGAWSWLFKAHILFFFLAIGVCLHLSRKVTSGATRSFLTLFGVTSIIAYTVGMVNMSPNSGLYPSSIAVLIFAIAVFTAFCVMHSRVVREMNHALFEQKEFLTRVIDSNPNLIYARNGEGRLTLANLSLARMLGRRKEEIIGRTPEELWGSPALEGQEAIDLPDNGAGQPNREERVTDAEGKERWLQTACVPIDISNTKQWLFVSNDITERKEFEKNITHLAYHDTLTGLPNRFSFHTDLVGQLSPPSRTVALLFLDLDRFKIINDTLGHSIGDLFLTAVADRLVFLMEDRGRVYRIGGDEFMVTLEDGGQEKAVSEAKRILDSFQRPFYVNEHELFTTTSIGISVSSDDGGDLESLMMRADMAMHRAKAEGKNIYRVYNQAWDSRSERKMLLEKELHKALLKEEFILHYQPQIDLATGQMVGAEALIRWSHPRMGLISPGEFIPLAEETGLIVPIGEWVIKEACLQARKWREAGLPPIGIAVNISPRQFNKPDLVETILGIIEQTNADPRYLELEITESVAMFDTEQVMEKLDKLKGRGIPIAMDDFGTGYSSLSYLKKLPIDKLKIDRSFLVEVTPENANDNASIVAAIISLARNLNLRVIAEGVENAEQLEFLKAHRCDEGQGYYFQRPVPSEELERLLQKRAAG